MFNRFPAPHVSELLPLHAMLQSERVALVLVPAKTFPQSELSSVIEREICVEVTRTALLGIFKLGIMSGSDDD
jgi:hypothetical protein